MTESYQRLMEAIRTGDLESLETWRQIAPPFPCGRDDFHHRDWLINAIDCGSHEVVSWMLSHGASARIEVNDGYTPLLSAIERKREDRHRVMEILIDAGADVDEKGIHGYTPAHMAAARNDVEALKILHARGADFSIRTEIDDHATPLEEAKELYADRAAEAIRYLEGLEG